MSDRYEDGAEIGAQIERERIRKLALEPSESLLALIHGAAEKEAAVNLSWLPYTVIRAVLRAFAEEIGR